jgi:hypothetical protein
MTTTLCAHTLTGVVSISALLLVTLIFWPLLALTFEAGLLVGIFLHSAHKSSSEQLLRKENQKT